MRLTPCKKPSGKLVPIDTPLNVRGQLFQTYRLEVTGDPNEECEHYEHNQTKYTWLHLEREYD